MALFCSLRMGYYSFIMSHENAYDVLTELGNESYI